MSSSYRHPLINQGMTLIELMIVISISAILVALAAPNFSPTIRNIRLTTATNDLLASLNLARSEAVKRGRDVVLGKSGANWENGWEIFVDVDRTPAADANVFNDDGDSTLCEPSEDCRLRVFPPLPGSYTLRAGNNVASFIRYTPTGISNYIPDGLSGIANDYFVICDSSDGDTTPQADTSRLIALNTVGKPRLGSDTNTAKDGIPNLAAEISGNNGNITTCTPG